jgi:hypothetical protein
VTEDEERPEHGSLRGPVERPDELAVEARGGSSQPQDDDNIAQHVAHEALGVLDPAVLGIAARISSSPNGGGTLGSNAPPAATSPSTVEMRRNVAKMRSTQS